MQVTLGTANVVGMLNDGRELTLWLSEHILVNVVRVLTLGAPRGYGRAVEQAEGCVTVLAEVAETGGGGVVEPIEVVTDFPGSRSVASSSAPPPVAQR